MSKAGFKLKGMDRFMRNLNREIKGLKKRTHAGLIKGAILIMNEADKMVPIDTSNLRHSFFIVSYRKSSDQATIPTRFKGKEAGGLKAWHSRILKQAHVAAKMIGNETNPVVIFGYSANYAAFVHENIDLVFKRPSAKARWLFIALQRTRKDVLEEVRKEASF